MISPHEPTGGNAAATPRFSPGQIVATAAAVEILTPEDIQRALSRHLRGDWGDVCEEDRCANESALSDGLRLLSVYHGHDGTKFWIITEHDRSITTVLLPSDY